MNARKKPHRKPRYSQARNRRLARKQASKLNFEVLEPKHLLAAITVGNSTDVSNAPDTSSITALIANDGGDGISLREAITAANNTSGEDTITFDANVFTGGDNSLIRLTQGELEIGERVSIDGTSVGGVVITGDANDDDVTIAGSHITDVSASFGGTPGALDDLLDDNSRVLDTSNFDVDLTLTGLTITGGRTTGFVERGGGISFTSGGTLTLTDSTVSGNSTTGESSNGGGIYTGFGAVSLVNSTLSGNSTSGFASGGGGIYNGFGDVSLVNSTLSGNSTTGYQSFGGGIFRPFNAYGSLSLLNSTLSGNSTTGDRSDGGGIDTGGDVSLVNSTLSGNSTTGYQSNGGGISFYFGGGISYVSGDITLVNSTVTGNSTSGAGGGVFVDNAFDNTSLTINNSIVADNVENATPGTVGTSNDLVPDTDGVLTINHSVIGVTDGLRITGGNNLSGTAAMPLDPLLGLLADNGGPTLTHRLLPGSPAIDAGNNALAVDESGALLTTDQRGETRIVDGTVDIGAYELQSATIGPRVISAVRDEGGVLARPDLLNTFVVTFDQDVNVVAGDLSIFNDTLGRFVRTSSVGFTYDDATLTASWDFSNLVLDAAFYTFELSDSITGIVGGLGLDGNNDGTVGGNYMEEVYVAIPGDANLDGKVDVLGDAFILVANLGTNGGAGWAQGDFNADGNVNVLGDAFILVANLNEDVRPSMMALASSSIIQSSTTRSADQLSVALPDPVSADVNDQKSQTTPGLILRVSEAPQLVLAGDHELRDDVFGSKF